MTTPAAGMIVAYSMSGNANFQRILNTVHYRLTADFANQSLDSFYTSFNDLLKVTGLYDMLTAYLACHATNYTLDFTRVQVVYPLRYRGKDFNQGGSGTATGDCQAQNVTAVITKQVELSGRSKVGSIHIGGLSEADYAFGLISANMLTRLGTLKTKLAATLFEDQGTGVATPVLYHPPANANPKYDIITGWIVQTQLRTQRTRTMGKGE